MQDKILKKHTALSQIELKNLTNSQNTIFNFLLYTAFLAKKEDMNASDFQVEIQQLLKDANVSLNSVNFKKIIEDMVRIKVNTNILGKSKEKGWSIFSLIAGAEFKNGILTFSFPHQIIKHLVEPKVYGLINLKSVNKLKTKAANVIYTLVKDYREYGTPKLTLENLDALIGVGQYDLRKFISKILKKAVAEINEKTELEIEMQVQKFGRKLHSVKFVVIKDSSKTKENKKTVATSKNKKQDVVIDVIEKNDDDGKVIQKTKKKQNIISDDIIKAVKRLSKGKSLGYEAVLINNYKSGDDGTVHTIKSTLKEIKEEEILKNYNSKIGIFFENEFQERFEIQSIYHQTSTDIYFYQIKNLQNLAVFNKPCDKIYPLL